MEDKTRAPKYVIVSTQNTRPDEDDIEQAITDSIDLDWTPRAAAKAVMRLLNTGGAALEARLAEIDAHRRKVLAENWRLLNALAERDRRIAELEKPLAPFAGIADLIDSETEGMSETDEFELQLPEYLTASLTASMFRAARRALTGGKEEG